MGYQATGPLTMAVLFFLFGLLLMDTRAQSYDRRVFNLLVLILSAWSLAVGMSFFPGADGDLLLWVKLQYVLGSLIPTALIIFSFTFPLESCALAWYHQMALVAINGVFFVLFLFFPTFMVTSVHLHAGVPVITFGPGQFFWYLHFYGMFLWGFLRLSAMYRQYAGVVRKRIGAVFWGTLVSFMLAGFTNTVLPLWGHGDWMWLGPPLTAVWLLCVAYAIFKYQFMDIKIFITRGTIHVLASVVTVAVFVCVLYVVEEAIGGVDQTVVLRISILVAVSALIFEPIKRGFTRACDRYFFASSDLAAVTPHRDIVSDDMSTSKRYQALANIAAAITHELKNPLTALKGYAHFFRQRMGDAEFLSRFIRTFEVEIERLDLLVGRLTEYSSPAVITIRSVDIVALVSELIATQKERAAGQKVTVVETVEHLKSVHLFVDSQKIQTVLTNIITNAFEAMPDGGTLSVLAEKTLNNFKITVRDTGYGIEAEHLRHIFDPFYSLKDQNAGLGLSIAQGIIEHHHGKIHAESQRGVGTQVIIELPLYPAGKKA